MTKLRSVLLRRWPILVVAFVLGAVGGFASAAVGGEREIANYQADQVIVANRGAANITNVRQDQLKVTRGAVPERAAELLDRPGDGVALARTIRARSSADANSITITSFDTDADEAGARVDAFAAAFLEVVNSELRSDDAERLDILAQRVVDAAQSLEEFDEANPAVAGGTVAIPDPRLDELRAERARLAAAVDSANREYRDFEIESQRRPPYSSLGESEPRLADAQLVEVPGSPVFRAALVGLIGLMLGVGLVLIIERANQRIDTRDELAEVVPFPILAEVNRVTARRQPRYHDGRIRLDGPWAEQYRRIKSAIQFSQAQAEGDIPRVFMFVSSLPAEGKSTSVALTATALAEDGQPTVAVNADFRVPRLERLLGADSSPSIADRAQLTTERASIDDVVQKVVQPNLRVAASGGATREVTRRLIAAREIAAEMASRGETVIIDSTPLHVANDTIDVLPVVDQVIFVVKAGRTTVRALEDALAGLEQHSADVLGVVLVGTLQAREAKAYYGYYTDSVRGETGARDALEDAVRDLVPDEGAGTR